MKPITALIGRIELPMLLAGVIVAAAYGVSWN